MVKLQEQVVIKQIGEQGELVYPKDINKLVIPEKYSQLSDKVDWLMSHPNRGAPDGAMVMADLESTLVDGELWKILGHELGDEELTTTTQDEPDFAALTERRFAALRRQHITIQKFLSTIHSSQEEEHLFDDAEDFIYQARTQFGRFVVATDCYYLLIDDIVSHLDVDAVIAHHMYLHKNDIVGALITLDQKELIAKTARAKGFKLYAVGDGVNDFGMLREANVGVLFRPSPGAFEAKKQDTSMQHVEVAYEFEQVLEYFAAH